ncbi:hexokinase-2-like [Antedon mediterranea]|uniref:hexokinase-2-like n=1 Tax=Antedon mediterranea TaxID=105859 RepID=UPI003AF92548
MVDSQVKAQVDSLLESLHLSDDNLKDIMQRLQRDMEKGLGAATNPTAKVKMFPSYVRSIPNGSESGRFFALDLGGSNFRVLLVTLLNGDVKLESKVFALSQEIMTGTGEQLFDYIATCLGDFKKEKGISEKLPLGFTFSFPCAQKGLTSAFLVTWTKGFSASGVENQDVVKLLQQSCAKQNVELDIVAVVNDTVGTLMSCAYTNPNCYIGLILGTGTNACYMENLDNVELWDGDDKEPRQVIINMEWGAFGDDGVLDDIRTDFDKEMDKLTPNKGKQLYEKMISGMYLGEITRQALLKLADHKMVFRGGLSDTIKEPWKFETRFLSEIEADTSESLTKVDEILRGLDLKPNHQDLQIANLVCQAVSSRAAKLAAAGVATVANQMNRDEVTVGTDGSLYKKHPKFHDHMVLYAEKLAPKKKVNFMLSEDGSGKGAALVAAVASRKKYIQVDSLLECLHLSDDNLKDIMQRLQRDMEKGLGAATNPTAKVKMLPSYVRSIPDGSENGRFLALDLGGSNFRVLLVTLLNGDAKMESKVFVLSQEIMTGTGEQLFDYIATCLGDFKKEMGISEKLPLGFTFSFPCYHKGLTSAFLVTWTKGYSASGVENQDVVKLLEQAFIRKNVELDIVAVVNDTVGTLMSCAYTNPNCYIGLILGSGCNACYMESLDNVELWDGDDEEPRQVIIDMEWGAFGDDGVLDDIRTDFDKEIDKLTLNKGKQLYEKMISGMYLGEITRRALLKLADHKMVFRGGLSDTIKEPWKFETRFLSEIEADTCESLTKVDEIIRSLDLKPTIQDLQIVKLVCQTVSYRAAKLAAAGVATVANLMTRDEITVGTDGSLYKKHPKFHDYMVLYTNKLAPKKKVNFMLSEDGSGKGAALVAAVASHKK